MWQEIHRTNYPLSINGRIFSSILEDNGDSIVHRRIRRVDITPLIGVQALQGRFSGAIHVWRHSSDVRELCATTVNVEVLELRIDWMQLTAVKTTLQ